MSKFHISGRRWFQRTYGNTYHSVRILDEEGNRIALIPMEYGYGDQYLTTGLEWLEKQGLLVDTRSTLGRGWCLAQANQVTYDVVDVDRKKDM